MRIGILKTDDVRPTLVGEFGEYPDMFMALLREVDPGLEFSIYDVQRDHYPESFDAADAYLITGSKAGVYEDIEWIRELSAYVRELQKANKKLVGICFGHQLVAHALGGRVEKSERGWGVGRHSYTLSPQAVRYGEPGSQFSVLASHQDQVLQPAQGARVLASSDFCPIAMTQVEDFALTFQGHPEFCPGYARNLMQIRHACIGEDRYTAGMSSLELPLDRSKVAGWMLDFMREQ